MGGAAILGFLSAIVLVGRPAPNPAEEDVQSEASKAEERPLLLTMPSFRTSARGIKAGGQRGAATSRV